MVRKLHSHHFLNFLPNYFQVRNRSKVRKLLVVSIRFFENRSNSATLSASDIFTEESDMLRILVNVVSKRLSNRSSKLVVTDLVIQLQA